MISNEIEPIRVIGRYYQGMVQKFNLGVKSKPDKDLRIKLIQEEAEEFLEAVKVENVVEVIDALCDLLYVTYGAADVFGCGMLDTEDYEKIHPTGKPNWPLLNRELEDFNLSVSDVVKSIRIHEQFNAKGKLHSELEDFAQGLWQCAAEGVGVDLRPFFEEVHRTNMHKLKGPMREDGKQLKPADWKPPRIEALYLRLRNGAPVECLGKHETTAVVIPTGAATRVPHPEGGYHCTGCGGLYVRWEADVG